MWFAPLPPLPMQSWRPYIGSDDFQALFASDAQWPTAAGLTDVFKVYFEWIYDTPEPDMRQTIEFLKAHGIALAIEVAPLQPGPDGCGFGVEGFGSGPNETLDAIRRIESLGGTVEYLALDEPFNFASRVYDGVNACHWSDEKVAAEVDAFIDGVLAQRPSIVVGDIEVISGGITAQDLTGWLAAYEAAAGRPFPFLHLDIDWVRSDWAATANAVQAYGREHGTRIGLIYNGAEDSSDEAWMSTARAHIAEYEPTAAAAPDDAVFQSWLDHPDRVLPETSALAFTSLIAEYARGRSELRAVQGDGGKPGKAVVTGQLVDAAGQPLADRRVDLSAIPLDGRYQLVELRGKVPAGQRSALVGIRTNIESAGPGKADLRIYEIGFALGSGASRVPNGRFASGPWWSQGKARATVVASDRGGGRMLRIRASTSQSYLANSAPFAVKPGAAYRLWVRVWLPQASAGSTAVDLIFLGGDGVETTRVRTILQPMPFAAGSAVTDATGAFGIVSSALDAGRYAMTVSFRGDARAWPTSARLAVEVAAR